MLGISVDVPLDNRRLREQLSIGLRLLTDPDLKTASAYGVAMEGKDIAVPSVFVVDQKGQIVWRYIGKSQVDRPDVDAIVDAIDRIR